MAQPKNFSAGWWPAEDRRCEINSRMSRTGDFQEEEAMNSLSERCGQWNEMSKICGYTALNMPELIQLKAEQVWV